MYKYIYNIIYIYIYIGLWWDAQIIYHSMFVLMGWQPDPMFVFEGWGMLMFIGSSCEKHVPKRMCSDLWWIKPRIYDTLMTCILCCPGQGQLTILVQYQLRQSPSTNVWSAIRMWSAATQDQLRVYHVSSVISHHGLNPQNIAASTSLLVNYFLLYCWFP